MFILLLIIIIIILTGIEGQSGKNMCQGGKPDTGKFHSAYIGMDVCGSVYENGCVVGWLRQRIDGYGSVLSIIIFTAYSVFFLIMSFLLCMP